MRLYELAYACRLYAGMSDWDSALAEFRRATSPRFDLVDATHRKALLRWLNSWGCRQFAVRYHDMASHELLDWGRRSLDRLPPTSARLAELSDGALDAAAQAYGDLKVRSASRKLGKSGSRIPVTFGPTGAAKVLYALLPDALPPWDDAIRVKLGYDGSLESYRRFLQQVQQEVRGLETEAGQLGIAPGDILAACGRPEFSLPKLIDEYYWVTVSRGFSPPTPDELERWARWCRA